MLYLRPGDGIGIRVGLRNQILGVRVSSGAPNFKLKKETVMSEFNVLVGKRINGLLIGNDAWSLVFRDINGRHYRFNTENDCCNSVWFNHVNGVETVFGHSDVFDVLRGATVVSVEDKGWSENRDDEDGYEVVQDGFWTIRTDRGYIDIEVRNSHNGYYGGSVRYDEGTSDLADFAAVTEDF